MERDIQLEVRSDPSLLGSIRGTVRGWIEAHGVSPDVVDDVVLAVDEACANAIRHSYGGRCDRSVLLTLRTVPDFLEIEVRDHGVPCPPERVEPRRLEVPDPEQLEPGGLGVQWMREIFDEVRFLPGEEGGNRVVMRLKKPR
jgi:sigma-B regulation protein RsbU (phosphoserine phosphatase)